MGRIIQIPGMLDPHTHLRGMDWSHKGTFASETAAALAGGYWAVFDMPNTFPSTIDRPALERKIREMSSQAVCDWGVYFGASKSNWDAYPDLLSTTCGLKIYNNDTTGILLIDDQTTRARHFAAWPNNKVIAVHAEGETVAEILTLVRQYHKWTHFCHISTAQEIAYLTAAKEEGLPISIGVCPHHLYLTEDDLSHLGSKGLMKPELKTKADQNALWQAIKTGVVDIIESDHAPHTLEEKSSSKPPYGVPGLETTLPLMLLAVKEKRLTLDCLVKLVASNPRKIFGLDCPQETYTVVDLDVEYCIDRKLLKNLCGWSPFEGMRVVGKVLEVWFRGQMVYDGENVLVSGGFGRNLFGT
jgi:carbamoyl-phosphate synthase/aspartate carbamoyltransferase/dihydroorotase